MSNESIDITKAEQTRLIRDLRVAIFDAAKEWRKEHGGVLFDGIIPEQLLEAIDKQSHDLGYTTGDVQVSLDESQNLTVSFDLKPSTPRIKMTIEICPDGFCQILNTD